MRISTVILACSFLVGTPLLADDGAKPTREQIQFFESKVRPLLATHCYKCHGANKQKGNLRLDSRASVFKGGETGPAVVASSPEESLLIEAINYQSLEMPPSGQLKDRDIEILTAWVARGASWTPGEMVRPNSSEHAEGEITEEHRQFWSFRPITRPVLPHVEDGQWIR